MDLAISSNQKEQYESRLIAYRSNQKKAPVVLLIFLAVFFLIVYLASVDGATTLLPHVLFYTALACAGIGFIYIVFHVNKIVSNIDKDIREGAYENRLEKLRFTKINETESKYSKELHIESRKKGVVTLLTKSLQSDRTYWFTFAVYSDVIVDVHPADAALDITNNISGNSRLKIESVGINNEAKSGNGELVPLEDAELDYYKKSDWLPTLLVSILIGAFPGLFLGIPIARYSNENASDPTWPIALSLVVFFSGILFLFLYRSILQTKKKVLRNPFKKIEKCTIHEIKKRRRSKETYYEIYFMPSGKKRRTIQVDVSVDQKDRITPYTGKFLVHVEVNERKVLRVTGEENEFFYSLV